MKKININKIFVNKKSLFLSLTFILPTFALSCGVENNNDSNANQENNNNNTNDSFSTSGINFSKFIEGDEYFDIFVEENKVNPNSISANIRRTTNEFGKKYWKTWIDNLGEIKDWEIDSDGKYKNLFCTTKRQALYLYSNCFGHFWNLPLHQNTEPNNQMLQQRFLANGMMMQKSRYTNEIRGEDYKLLQNSLLEESAITPANLILYHGVEFMENEFWDQISSFVQGEIGNLDFSNTIGKTLTSYGFLSTTTIKVHAINFSNGRNWIDNTTNLPLKEPTVFKIKVPKKTKGIAYVSGFDINGYGSNEEAQFIIKKDSKFLIESWEKEDNINILTITMIE